MVIALFHICARNLRPFGMLFRTAVNHSLRSNKRTSRQRSEILISAHCLHNAAISVSDGPADGLRQDAGDHVAICIAN